MSHANKKEIQMLIQLAQKAGFINQEEFLASQRDVDRSPSMTPNQLVRRWKLNPEVSKLLWRLAQLSPGLKVAENLETVRNLTFLKIDDVDPELRNELLFADQLLRRQRIPSRCIEFSTSRGSKTRN